MIKIHIQSLFRHEEATYREIREINSARGHDCATKEASLIVIVRARLQYGRQDQNSQSILYAGHVYDVYRRARGDMRVHYPREGRDFLRYSTFVFLRPVTVSCMTMSCARVCVVSYRRWFIGKSIARKVNYSIHSGEYMRREEGTRGDVEEGCVESNRDDPVARILRELMRRVSETWWFDAKRDRTRARDLCDTRWNFVQAEWTRGLCINCIPSFVCPRSLQDNKI